MTEQRAALVTGAGRGIGRAVAQRLVDDGFDVLSVDLEPDPDGPGVPHAADLATREGNRGAVEAAIERFGRLDVVVANAGLQHVAPVAEFDEDRWDQLLAVLLTSPFLLAKHAWAALSASGESRFVAIASAHALVASPHKAAYVSAKHGCSDWSRRSRSRAPTPASRRSPCARATCARRSWSARSSTRPRPTACPRRTSSRRSSSRRRRSSG
jgi:NAD(P)-dependent dehydrogenase (short-subunit alcohol dehydrogenase family)